MALQDINWGAVIIGAAAVTGLAAAAMIPVASGGLGFLTVLAADKGVALVGAALAGGVLGHWTTKVAERAQDATVALVHR